jgi:predicted dehydrogenase
METVRFGVIGLGFTGMIHALNALKLPGASLAAVAEPSGLANLEKETQEQGLSLDGVKSFPDGAALIEEGELDAVVICLPTHLHEETALSAFNKELHVLCEKPIALNEDQADNMIQAAEESKRLFMVAHCLRFWPEYQYLRNTIARGEMGRLLSLNLHRISGVPTWSWKGWLLDPSLSGGPLIDLHIHDVDFALSILGRPDKLFASGRSSMASGGLDIVHALYQYKHGPQVHLHGGWSTVQVPFQAGYEAWFDKGFLRYQCGDPSTLECYEMGSQEPVPVAAPPWDAYEEELRYFMGCILTEQEPELCPPTASKEALGLALEGMETAKAGMN